MVAPGQPICRRIRYTLFQPDIYNILMPRPLTGIQQRAYDLGFELPVAGSATKELVSWAHRQGRMIHRYCSVATPAEGREIANALEVGMAGRDLTLRSEVAARGKSVERQRSL